MGFIKIKIKPKEKPYAPSTTHWTDAGGRRVLIRDMSDAWLNNIRKMFAGNKRYEKKIQPILLEIKRRKINRKRKIHNI